MKNLNYILVDYSSDDYEFVYQTKKDAYKSYVKKYYGEWIEEDQRIVFDEYLKKVQNHIKIIKINNKKIGFVEGFQNFSGDFELGNICIINDFQRMGIGTSILNALIEKYENNNIFLRVFKINPAKNLYENLGFKVTSETRTHFNMKKCK